jgi:UDP-N-acetylmuramate dehydrogenase
MIVKTLKASELSFSKHIGNDYKIHFLNKLSEANEIAETAFILGNGTNTLFHNTQNTQIVSLKNLSKIQIEENFVNAEAGILLPELIHKLKSSNLGGLEFTYPIPASLGGAITQNFSAYNKTIGDLIISICCYDKKKKTIHNLNKEQCYFDYRSSIFKNKNLVILSANLLLENNNKETITKNCEAIKQKRINNYPISRTLGSIFKNPSGMSAGKIIDECGLKGYKHKSVKICDNHANVFVFNKNSSTNDALELIYLIKQTVKNRFQIELIEEIIIY